jgi:hypothetical protein
VRLRRLALGVVSSALVAAVLPAGSAGAEAFVGSYAASANADGVRLTFIAPKASLSDTVADVGGPSAQATMDSIGTSRAFASFPYPGETAVTSTGLVRTLSGVPVPDYPLYASSDHPIVPSREIGSGIFALKAESAARRSAAVASVGLAVEGAGTLGLVRSTASTDATGEAVVSEARSVIESLSIGPLRLGHVVSTARVSLAPDGQLTRQSGTEVVGATVAGTDVAITPDGLKAGGTAVGAPPAAPVADLLAKAGITVELVKAQQLPTGVAAPAVRITQQQQSGTKLIYVLGAASATAKGEGVGSGLANGPATGGPATTGGEAAPAGSPAPANGEGPSNAAPTAASEVLPPDTGTGEAGAGPAPAGAGSFRAPAGLVVPDAGSLAAPPTSGGGSSSEAAAVTGPGAAAGSAGVEPPGSPGQASVAGGARAAALAAVLGTGVDAKPVYGAFAIGGILGLALLLAMRGLSGGGNR